MKGLDTNVLVRFLVNDDAVQSKIVYDLFKAAEARKKTFWVSLLVVLETIWVLESVYEISREEILESLNELLLMPVLKFENQTAILHFVLSAQKNSLDLSGVLIACSANEAGCDCVITVDKKASKFELFELISPKH